MDDKNLTVYKGGYPASLDSPDFLAALYAMDGGSLPVDLPVPYEADTFLIGTAVAGTKYQENIGEKCKDLELGERLTLVREPNNPYDERAIAVHTSMGDKLGYVPRAVNLILSRLMDAGHELYALVRDLSYDLDNRYYLVVMKIYLSDGRKKTLAKAEALPE